MVQTDRICGNVNCKKIGKHLCSGCGEEIYCSKDCQKEHWAAHKLACQTAVKPEATAFLKSFDALSVKQLKNIMKAKSASFDKKKKDRILASLDRIVEKPALVRLVEEHVTLDEIESLLTASAPNTDATTSSSSSINTKKKATKASTNAQQMPTPEQLRQNAKMMREHPNMVRQQNAAFKNMTDAQIRAYADQMEQAASDPNMMKEVERMSKLSESERNDLQAIQEGLAGTKPMDFAWMDRTIASLKTNSKLFKTMMHGKGGALGGVTDEQVDSFIDMAAGMDAYTLKLIFRALVYLGSLYRPSVNLYEVVDKYTFGMTRYFLLAIFAFVMYYISMFVFFILKIVFWQVYALVMFVVGIVSGKTAATAATSTASTVLKSAGVSTFKSAVEKTAAAAGFAGVASTLNAAVSGAVKGNGLTPGAAGAVGGETQGAEKDDADYDF